MKKIINSLIGVLFPPKKMTDNYETLKQLVISEVIKLKKHATTTELSRLNIRTFSAYLADTCIYGQITGHCASERAGFLIKKCAKRVYHYNGKYNSISAKFHTGSLNGKPTKVRTSVRSMCKVEYVSPIEKFIAITENYDNGNNERIIRYLRGETNKLELI